MNALDRLDQQLQGWLDIFPASQMVSFEITLANLRALLDVARAAELIAAEQHVSTTSRFWDTIAISQAALAPLLEDTE